MSKKRFAMFLAFVVATTSVYPAFADEINNANAQMLPIVANEDESKQSKGGNIYCESEGLSPLLKDFKESQKGDTIEVEKVVYLVEYENANDKANVLEAIKKIEDTKVLYEYDIIFQGCAVQTWPKNLELLQSIKGVKSVERSGQMKPLMNSVRKIIGIDDAVNYLNSIHAENLAQNLDGRGMLISHIDTGMDASHQAMRIDPEAIPYMKIKPGSDPFWVNDKVPHAFNYMTGGKETKETYDDGSDYHDPHGMHIAGILAGNDTPDKVLANKGIRGVAPNAQLLSYKMYSDSSDAFAGDETMFHAFEDSIKMGADVASISSGFTGTGLVGEKYWPAIRAMRKAGIPVFVATGNFATSSSNSSWDLYANNALGMTDTGNVTRTAAHEDAIAVGSARNTTVYFPKVKIGNIIGSSDQRKDFRYSQIGAFFDKNNIKSGRYNFIYLGKCQDEDIDGFDLRDKIVVMDRIYTGDLKYAFKKAQDKGAKMVIVVNTVSYYNRDDWENVPAMGYEKDEKTSMQVISLSGYDGAMLWDMIKPGAIDRSSNVEPYRIDMQSFNARKPQVGQEVRLWIEFTDDLIKWEENYQVPAGSTSWGPRTDLMLKPDLSAPGKNIYSTLNRIGDKHDYAYMSGTSMSTPVAAGASVLIRPKLQKMVESPVLKSVAFAKDAKGYEQKEYDLSDANFTSGIDLASLTKIVMQNTATPMPDVSTAINSDITTALPASPRQQGAGLINVERALKTDVIATHETKDSVGIYNAYGSISLKEIRGGSKDFTIKLYNTSDKDMIYDVSYSPITTDGTKKVTKLDEEYIDQAHTDGTQIVNEIHPVVVDGASITFNNTDNGKITVPAGSSFSLNATLHAGSASDMDKFVESFISFKTQDNTKASLSMPLMGFAGDWNKEPIIDKWAWEEGSLSGKITVFDDSGKPKRPGTLNYGAGGEHGVDNFHPAGVIQNTADGNPDFKQDPEYFAMNTASDVVHAQHSSSDLIMGNKKKVKIVKQNGKETYIDANDLDVNNAGLTPSPLVLRSASDSKIYIANEKGHNLRTMAVQHFVRGILNSKRNTAKGLKDGFKKVWGDLKWQGDIFDPSPSTGTGDLKQVAEGLYYYTFEYRLTPEYPWQKTAIPIRVDNTSPTIDSIDLSDLNSIKIFASDTYHKAKDIQNAQNGVYFLEDQETHPDLFENVKSKVWYVGAAFVNPDENTVLKDNDGNVTGHLDVLRTDDGKYVIKNTYDSLEGKTLEIVAVDGAGNYAPTMRVKFDDNAVDGKLGYKVQQFEKVNSSTMLPEFKDISTNTSSNNLNPIKPNPINPANPGHGEENIPDVEGAPVITLDKSKSGLGKMKDSKKAKSKKFENVYQAEYDSTYTKKITTGDVLSVGKKCTIKDENEIPKYYDIIKWNDDSKLYSPSYYGDGQNSGPSEIDWDDLKADADKTTEEKAKEKGITLFPMEYDYVTQDTLEKEGKFLIDLRENDGFSVIGTMTNVDKTTKVYFQSEVMAKNNKKKLIPTYLYDKNTHTMKFDFYGNRNDSSTGDNPFDYNDGKIYIWAVNNNGKSSNKLTLTMPDSKTDSTRINPWTGQVDKLLGNDDYSAYNTDIKNIAEFKRSDDGKGGYSKEENGTFAIDALPSGKKVTNDAGKQYELFNMKDRLRVKKGYAVRIVSYNAGKTSTKALSNMIYPADPSKMGSDEWSTFGQSGKGGDYFIDIGILQGFNAIRYEVHKPKLTSSGAFERDVNDKLILNDDTLVFAKGRCVFFDKDPVVFNLDEDTFNPYYPDTSKVPELYTRTNPMTIRGNISDKGGFMWHLRINHHIIDEYLIYGDLKIDNTKDFSFTTDVKDGDTLDFGVKDYSGNAFPEKTYKKDDGSEYTAQMPDKYKVYIDDVKPTIEIAKDNSITDPTITLTPSSTTATTSNALQIKITDKITSGKDGRLQTKAVYVNGTMYTSDATIAAPVAGSPWEVVIIAQDYAGNKSVLKYIYTVDGDLKDITPSYKVTFDLDGGSGYLFNGSNELTIKEGEDLFMPYPSDITSPMDKEFDKWQVKVTDPKTSNVTTLMQKPGSIIDVSGDIAVKAIWKDKSQKQSVKITLNLNDSNNTKKDIKLYKGDNYSLPDGKYLTKKDGYDFTGWKINDNMYKAGDKITVDKDIIAVAIWQESSKKPDPKPTPGGTSHGGGGGGGGGGGSSSSKKDDKPQTPQTPSSPSKKTDTTDKITLTKQEVAKILLEKAKDVDTNNWAATAIASVIDRKLMNGVGNGNFAPYKNITRAEIATIIHNYKNRETIADVKAIKDVSPDKWYAKSVSYVEAKGYVVGYPDGTFRPENNITRAEYISVIARLYDIAPVTDEQADTILQAFADYADIPAWAKTTIAAVVKSGLIKGDGQNINPNKFITRAEVAAILSRI